MYREWRKNGAHLAGKSWLGHSDTVGPGGASSQAGSPPGVKILKVIKPKPPSQSIFLLLGRNGGGSEVLSASLVS